jgi:allantoate deiminase
MPVSTNAGRGNSKARAEEIVARCKRLAGFSEDTTGTRRTFLSAPMHDCHREIASWLSTAGAAVRVDAVGNLCGLYPGVEANAPRLLIGSHLDTVPNAGAYDGALGVVLGVGLLEALEDRKLPFAIEVLGFSEEEGVRFGTPFIGSRALVGRVDEELLNRHDANGVSVRAAIASFGLDASEMRQAIVKEDTLGYLEFHIEQGPVLESMALPLAAVETIAAQNRMEFIFSGHANHAGTTPMHLRRDAVAGAAEWITAVEHAAQTIPGLVATVGQIEAKPGAVNVIAASARVSLDVRHGSDEICKRTTDLLIGFAEGIARRRELGLTRNELLHQTAVRMDPFLVDQIEKAIQSSGCHSHRMVSGAGHDAMIVSDKVPSAMIFLRSPGGISHHPAESVNLQDVEKALECGLHLLNQLAQCPEFLKRMCRA